MEGVMKELTILILRFKINIYGCFLTTLYSDNIGLLKYLKKQTTMWSGETKGRGLWGWINKAWLTLVQL